MAISPELVAGLKNLFTKYPHIAAPLLGAGAGGLTGAVFSEEGAGQEGATRGALLGAGLGAGAGLGLGALRNAMPGYQTALLGGTLAGGGLGGIFGSTHPSAIKVERMKRDEDERRTRRRERLEKAEQEKQSSLKGDAAMAEQAAGPAGTQTKEAEVEAMTAERMVAFEFGMEAFCKEAQITSDQLAQAAGVSRAYLVPATVNWLTAQLAAEKQAQAPAPAAK